MEMSSSEIEKKLQNIQEKLAELTESAGRPAGSVRLVAVSKNFPVELVKGAYEAGQRLFGENRVQELNEKAAKLPSDCEWHLVGHLQSNKVRDALKHAAWIHSIDSVKLVQRINRIGSEENVRPVGLIQVNVVGEGTKFGVDFEGARTVLENSLDCSHVDIRGLMTMAPYGASPTTLHRTFASLRELRDTLQAEFGCQLPELSMGMSGDYETAVKEGSTLVRIGTAIFGKR